MKSLTFASLATLGASLAACTTVESDNILTSGMYADIAARASGDGTTRVSATLYLGNPINLDFIDLTGSDELDAIHDGQTKVMSETIILNVVSHAATFQADAEDDEFIVDFVRDVDPGAPDSVVTLPAPFEIDPTATSASRADDLTLTWSPASPDPMRWSASGNCIDTASGSIDTDTGGMAMTAGTLVKRTPAQGEVVPDSCQVTVTVSRSRLGDLDPHYGEGGTIVGEQTRSFSFTSTP